MALDWRTIHIFGNSGIVQVISNTSNKKIQSSRVTTLNNITNEIYSHKPNTYTCGNNYRIITIVNGFFCDWYSELLWESPNTGRPKSDFFKINCSELDSTKLSNFLNELDSLI